MHGVEGAWPAFCRLNDHLAFNVDTTEELLAMRDRIRSKGVNVIGHNQVVGHITDFLDRLS